MVRYEQCFDGEKGARESSLLTIWRMCFGKDAVKDAKVLLVFQAMDAFIFSVGNYRVFLSNLSDAELEKEKNTSYQRGGNFPVQLSYGDRKKLIKDETQNRKQNEKFNHLTTEEKNFTAIYAKMGSERIVEEGGKVMNKPRQTHE